MKTPVFMIVPSLACRASCKYCFGPHRGAVMDARTAVETARFVRAIAEETAASEVSVIFHGGEPLLAPLPVWETLLGELRAQLAGHTRRLSLQSNLWHLTDELLALFGEHQVSIGTSLDGPEALCDLNRGEGYFRRTQASVAKARAAGHPVSAIATVTRQTLPHVETVVRHFRDQGMPLVLHGALPGMDARDDGFALDAKDYAAMIKGLFPWYIKNRTRIKIDTFDHFVHGVVWGRPGVCTFNDCFGMFLSISPDGDITSCQRLAGRKAFTLGNIFDRPTLAALHDSPAARAQRERERQAGERCAACDVYPVCKGGCYYHALSSGDGVVDPWCEAYREIYAFVQERLMQEMQSEENIAAIADRPAAGKDGHPLLRKGACISLSHKVHPTRVADNARRVLAIHELGRTGDPRAAAENLHARKICGDIALTEKLLVRMQRDLRRGLVNRNNCYIHVTFDCNLRCTHCYAEAGVCRDEMAPGRFATLAAGAAGAGFRQIVITGGEPSVHSRWEEIVSAARDCRDGERLRGLRGRKCNLALRTNLAGDFAEKDFIALAESFDQVVVSVDGNEQTHDARRGRGTYARTLRNLDAYVRLGATAPRAAELSLACVMRAADINGEPGESVRRLGDRLHVKRIRFRPLLPLGRAAQLDEPVMCEGLMQHVSPDEMLRAERSPMASCGIGQNLFIRPDGRSYPCYAWCGEHTYIGNVFEGGEDGLEAVLASPRFVRLTGCSVDTIEKCRDCEYRYLCGGACRAWGNRQSPDLNAPPAQCDHLKKQAQQLIEAARAFISPKD
ncbi:MAG: SPASM domain-containing protein [Opitutaceae bacterium]|jgi:uncharacterized protein|nr:SPASM domain-containing protein [Opitutaceae bacterium]